MEHLTWNHHIHMSVEAPLKIHVEKCKPREMESPKITNMAVQDENTPPSDPETHASNHSL